ncbi:MAG: HAD family hydrolase [Bacteroidales bacterium]|nr:HAD family hydrolase [Bacteroidales bacterium]
MQRPEMKVALFDLDGVVFDTESQYSIFWKQMGKEYRPDVEGLEDLIKGQTLVQIYDRFFPDPDLQRTITEKLYAFEKTMDYRYVPGAKEYILSLKERGIKTAVVTSSNKPKMENVFKNHPDFKTLFDRILTSEDFKASKPDPDCYLLGSRVFEVPVDKCVVFEDSFSGLKAGNAANMYVVGLATTNTAESIKPYCHEIISDFVGFSL